MKNHSPQQQRELVVKLEHDKESAELVADSSAGVDGSSTTTTTTTTPATTTTTTTTATTAYEEQFVKESTGESTTSYSLFSNGDAFTDSAIRSKTHYIRNEIMGQLWLDVDGNGKRGSFTDSTLNAQEQDSGLTGVDVIVLVDCETDTEVAVTKSQPVRGDGEVVIQKVTETSGVAGAYRFPEAMARAGRYYIVYKAPTNFRINANVLPTNQKKMEMNADGSLSYFECPFVGGEGESFYQDALANGDFDNAGYCGRTVGCFEVGRKADLEQKFTDLVELDGATGEEVASDSSAYGPDDMVVVYPSQHMLDVGLSQEGWPLNTRQFAEVEVDLLFPENSTEVVASSLGETLESDSALAGSTTVEAIERSLLESIIGSQQFSDVELEVEGVAMSTIQEQETDSSESSEIFARARYLRASRKLQESDSSSATPTDTTGYTVVTYKFTARGGYNPPPQLQLGEIAEQSINADSRKLTKTLQDKVGDVFVDLQTINAKHMTVKKPVEIRPPPLEMLNAQNAESRSGGLATWATVPIILLALMISGLIGLFLFRRAFSRRKVVHHNDVEKGEEKKTEQYDYEEDDIKVGYADEEAAQKRKEDPMDTLMVVAADKAEEVPANMASSGTDGSSGNSEERNADSSERRRRKPKSRKSKAREFASSLKRSLTLEKTESVLSDISDHLEKRKRRKKAKEQSRHRDSEQEDDAEESSERKSRKSSRRSSGSSGRMSDLRNSLKAAAGDVAELSRKKKSSRSKSEGTDERSSKSKSRRSRKEDVEE
jgi:hypothetical protein